MPHKRCNGEVAGEDAAERGPRTLRAEGALNAIVAGPVPQDRLRGILEQALVFAGASFAALYTPGDDRELLCLVESAGVPRSLYGVRDSYPASGGSPVADAHRAGEAVWIGPEEFAGSAESRHVPSSGFSLAVLPVRGDGGGCFLALTERPDGFDADDRTCLEVIAEAMTCPAPAGTADRVEAGDLQPDAFTLAMDTGRAEVGDDILRLFGLAPGEFDGKVETLLGLTVPEDLPSLMSVTESDHMTIGERELEFRVLQPTGPPKWLRLSGRLLPGGDGRPALMVGTVADASTL
ncbi:PAS domain-containing protein, partial [Streptomyces rubrogriseus]